MRRAVEAVSVMIERMLLLPAAAYTRARYKGENWVELTSIELSYSHLPEAFDGTRVLVFSDVHLGHYYYSRDLASLIKQSINPLRPDLVCFTGDLFDKKMTEREQVISALRMIKAPLGKYAVLGNHDYYDSPGRMRNMYRQADFTMLLNESTFIHRGDQAIRIAGVDDMVKGRPDLHKALHPLKEDEFIILLSHAPDFADRISNDFPVSFQASGHSHGGQVRLPGIGHLTAPLYGRKYVNGLYPLKEGELMLYTNRGIGLSVFPIRFWCKPEITLITLKTKPLNCPNSKKIEN
ncbi:metallophosphoesterase [Paenibacillus senegalensis]|uniref:metallophosphoesterase n=1 Tax=Paenibacillus senegalensis TaxID=1465766 RepID=UPI0005A66C77|nr:metallophosphoesterase [Paenibacillus senegalensis]